MSIRTFTIDGRVGVLYRIRLFFHEILDICSEIIAKALITRVQTYFNDFLGSGIAARTTLNPENLDFFVREVIVRANGRLCIYGAEQQSSLPMPACSSTQ